MKKIALCLILAILVFALPQTVSTSPGSEGTYVFLGWWGLDDFGFTGWHEPGTGTVGDWGSGDGEFDTPRGIAVDSGGNIYVADSTNDRIQKFDSSGIHLATLGSYGDGDGQFNTPWGVAVDSEGNVYVADTLNHRIQKLDSFGGFLGWWGLDDLGNTGWHTPGSGRIGKSGSVVGAFNWPRGVAVDSGGNVYVADSINHRIQKFDSDGGLLLMWGSSGFGDGQFYLPGDVAVDSGGNVYVADSWPDRIQKFDSNGIHLATLGSYGDGDGEFDTPWGVAVDSYGNIYAADTSNHRIQKFDSDGKFLGWWGLDDWGDTGWHPPGTGTTGIDGWEDGQFYYPYDMAVDSDGNIYVADTFNDRIQKIGPVPPPVARDDEYTINEDEVLTKDAPGVLGNDSAYDADDILTAILVDDVSDGNLTLYDDGSFTYTPDENFSGSDSFTYKANDGTQDSEVATVTITIEAINDAPVADDQSVTTDEDIAVDVTLTAADVDDNILNFVIVAEPTQGTLSGTAPALTYTPNSNFNGLDSFTFQVNDGKLDSGVATIGITVNPVNDPPEADAGPDQIVVADEQCQAEVTLNGTGSIDIDGDILTYTWEGPFGKATGPQPTVTLGSETHPITIVLTVDDGNGGTATAIVLVTVEDKTPPTILLSDSTCVDVSKWKIANLLTISASDNCSSDVELVLDKVKILNKHGRRVWGRGIYSVVGNDIYVFPNGRDWSIVVTVTASDSNGNTKTESLSKPLLQCNRWSAKMARLIRLLYILIWKWHHCW